jgi:hypothetical protein
MRRSILGRFLERNRLAGLEEGIRFFNQENNFMRYLVPCVFNGCPAIGSNTLTGRAFTEEMVGG